MKEALALAAVSIGMCFFSVGLTATPARGQPLAGDRELQAGIGVFHAQGSSSGNLNGDASVSLYLQDPRWQIGAAQGVAYQFIDGSSDVWTASTTPFFSYNFLGFSENDVVVPFVGAFVGVIWNDRDVTGTAGPRVGLKVFLSSQAFLAIRYRYEAFFGDLKLSGSESTDGNHIGTMGLGFIWGAEARTRAVLQEEPFLEQANRIEKRAEEAAKRAEQAAERAQEAAEKANAECR